MTSVVPLYQKFAAAYDQERSRDLMELPYLQDADAGLAEGATVLDIGCGAGEPITRYFIDRGRRVVGLDAAPAMIEICRARFPAQRWIVGDMRALQLNEDFDAVIAWDSFFHLPPDDQREMIARFSTHLKENGALLFTTGDDASVAHGEFHGSPLYHASLDEAEYRRLLAEAGLRTVRYAANDPDCGGHTVWLARKGPARS